MKKYDAVIIGAGVTGCAIARELSRRQGRFLVLERALDVCEGTSKANSAIVHAGFDAQPGSLKAKMNREGSLAMDKLCEELDVPFRRAGALVSAWRKAGSLPCGSCTSGAWKTASRACPCSPGRRPGLWSPTWLILSAAPCWQRPRALSAPLS